MTSTLIQSSGKGPPSLIDVAKGSHVPRGGFSVIWQARHCPDVQFRGCSFIATRHALAVAGRFSELTQITAAQLSKPSGRHRVSVRLLLLALDTKPEEDEAEGIHVRELAENLALLGHEVDLCVSRESSWTVGGGTKGLWVRPIGGGPRLSELLHVLSEARAFGPHAVYERRFLPRVSA